VSNTYTREGEYKGYPTLSICYMRDEEEKTLISFGVKKAEAICDHIDEIRVFADKNGKEK
jgi:hypothetical protein